MPKILSKRFKDFDAVLAHSQPSNWLAYHISYLHQSNRFLYPRKIDRITGWSSDLNMDVLNWLHRFRVLVKKLDKLSINNSNRLLVNSNWIKYKVHKNYGQTSRVCYPGVDLSDNSYCESLLDGPFILTTNRHYPQKGLHLIIKCFSHLKSEYDDLKCVLTGEYTPYTQRLIEYAQKMGVQSDIVFTDNLNELELKTMYQNAYLYSYSSPEEDFGLGPLEAGANGVPSIVWDHAGPKETVINGVTGFRVPPYDLQSFVDRHYALLNNPDLRNRMGKMAYDFVSKTFPWEKHVNILKSELQKI